MSIKAKLTYQKAKFEFSRKKYDKALSTINKAISTLEKKGEHNQEYHEFRANIRHQIAIKHINERNLKSACEQARQALNDAPNSPFSYQILIEIELSLQQRTQISDYFLKWAKLIAVIQEIKILEIIHHAKRFAHFWNLVCDYYIQEKQHSYALICIDEAKELYPLKEYTIKRNGLEKDIKTKENKENELIQDLKSILSTPTGLIKSFYQEIANIMNPRAQSQVIWLCSKYISIPATSYEAYFQAIPEMKRAIKQGYSPVGNFLQCGAIMYKGMRFFEEILEILEANNLISGKLQSKGILEFFEKSKNGWRIIQYPNEFFINLKEKETPAPILKSERAQNYNLPQRPKLGQTPPKKQIGKEKSKKLEFKAKYKEIEKSIHTFLNNQRNNTLLEIPEEIENKMQKLAELLSQNNEIDVFKDYFEKYQNLKQYIEWQANWNAIMIKINENLPNFKETFDDNLSKQINSDIKQFSEELEIHKDYQNIRHYTNKLRNYKREKEKLDRKFSQELESFQRDISNKRESISKTFTIFDNSKQKSVLDTIETQIKDYRNYINNKPDYLVKRIVDDQIDQFNQILKEKREELDNLPIQVYYFWNQYCKNNPYTVEIPLEIKSVFDLLANQFSKQIDLLGFITSINEKDDGIHAKFNTMEYIFNIRQINAPVSLNIMYKYLFGNNQKMEEGIIEITLEAEDNGTIVQAVNQFSFNNQVEAGGIFSNYQNYIMQIGFGATFSNIQQILTQMRKKYEDIAEKSKFADELSENFAEWENSDVKENKKV